MIQSVVTAIQAPDIRRKILFTAFILLIFRVLTAVPVPNVDQARLSELFATNQLLALLDIFSGGGLATASHHRSGPEPVHQRQHHHAAHAGRDPAPGGAAARG